MNIEFGGDDMPPTGLGGDPDELLSSFLGAVTSARIKRVFDYWIALRQERPFPAWVDVKLMDVYDLAPFLAVFDVEAAGDAQPRFRYRFCGTWLVDARTNLVPADPTGHCLDDLPWPFDSSPLVAACAKVVAQGRPVLLAAGEVQESAYHLHERGFFPLGSDDEVAHILVCIDEVEPPQF